jgi:hypothetical protein
MFQLTEDEFSSFRQQIESANLRSQIATSSWGGRRYLPYAFTEQGVAMLSSVLRSKRAIQVNVEIMRAFVRLRRMLASNEELARKLAALERKYDAQFKVVFDAIRELMAPPSPKIAATVTGFMSLRAVSQRQFFKSRSETPPVSRGMKSKKWSTTTFPWMH